MTLLAYKVTSALLHTKMSDDEIIQTYTRMYGVTRDEVIKEIESSKVLLMGYVLDGTLWGN